MKLIFLFSLFVAFSLGFHFPFNQLMRAKRQPTELPSSHNMVPVQSCSCFEVDRMELQCLPKSLPIQEQDGKFWSCNCWESKMELDDRCPYVEKLLCPADLHLQYFDVFSLDSVTVRGRCMIDGRLAAAKMINLSGNYTINYLPKFEENRNASEPIDFVGTSCTDVDDLPQDYRYALIAGESLELSAGHILSGYVVHGANESNVTFPSLTLSHDCEVEMNSNVIDFNHYRSDLLKLSSDLSALEISGNTTFESGALICRGSGAAGIMEVFNISSVWFAQAIDFQVMNVSDDVKAIIFNVEDPSLQPGQANITYAVPNLDFKSILEEWGTKVIWNFGEAGSVTFTQGSNFYGVFLAPLCRLVDPLPTFFGPLKVNSIDCQDLTVHKIEEEICVPLVLQDMGTPTAGPTPTNATATTASARK